MGKQNRKLRMCVACRSMRGKEDLIRLTKDNRAGLFIDESGKHGGRGAYICKDTACIEKAEKTHCFERALKCSMTPEIIKHLKALCP